jgi:hypothetical protein
MTLESGESVSFLHFEPEWEDFERYSIWADLSDEDDRPDPPRGKLSQDSDPGGKRFLFLGYIIYEDALGRRRNTAFLRRYSFATKTFSPMSEYTDYEYQD